MSSSHCYRSISPKKRNINYYYLNGLPGDIVSKSLNPQGGIYGLNMANHLDGTLQSHWVEITTGKSIEWESSFIAESKAGDPDDEKIAPAGWAGAIGNRNAVKIA